MKKLIFLSILFLLPALAMGQLLQLRSTTSAYAWQKQDDTLGTISNHLFAYQSLQLSVAKNDITFGTYVQGYSDLKGPTNTDPVLRVQSLYLQVRNIAQLADVTVGRQAIFAGAGNGAIDGARATVRLLDSRLNITAYGGGLLPVRQKPALTDDIKNNYMAGGQIVGEPLPWIRTSLSFVDRAIGQRPRVDSVAVDNVNTIVIREYRPSAMHEQILSGDVEAEYEHLISGHLRYDYDTKLARQSRFEVFTRITPVEKLGVTLEYLNREPRLYYNSLFTVFTYATLTEFEGGLEYEIDPTIQVFGRVGRLSYGDETENRITLGGNWTYVSASLSHSVGTDSRISAASFTAGYPLLDNTVTPTLSLSYAMYKLSEAAPSDGALSAGLGATYRPMRTLAVDAQLQWNQNKVLANDLRLFLRLNYFFSQQLGLF